MRKINKKTSVIIIVVVATIIVFFSFIVFELSSSDDSSNSVVTDNSKTSDKPTSVTAPKPTNEKVAVIEKNNPQNSPTSGKQQITPIIVYAGVFGSNLEISAYAPVVESDGLCTAEITNQTSGKITTKNTASNPSASTTDCELFKIPTTELSTGTYSITVNYASADSAGQSQKTEVQIP